MTHSKPIDKTGEFEKALNDRSRRHYALRLYVIGLTEKSIQAIDDIKRICESDLKGAYELEIIDLGKQPELAKEADIIGTPTLLKILPTPLRRLIGDLSDKDRVLRGLDIKPKT